MTETAPPRAFADLQARLDTLHDREAVTVRAGHADLEDGIWLSCDPEGEAEMTCRPAETGFHLGFAGRDSGNWASFGLRLPVETLARGRYVGLLVEAAPEALVSVSPSLRYRFADGGMQDAGPAEPLVMPAGPQTHLIHIAIDPDLLGRAADCELNLFFHSDQGALAVARMEPLLIS